MNTTNIIRIGPHSAWIEPPDIFVTHWRGGVTPSHLLAMLDEVEKFASSQPNILSLNIVRDTTEFSPSVRKVAATDPRSRIFVARAVVGASFQVRVLATMLMKAKALISRDIVVPMFFCDTDSEGRAWLAKRRQELAAPSR